MFGYQNQDLILLDSINVCQTKFDPTLPEHARLLEQGLVVKVKQNYYAMPTVDWNEASYFEQTVSTFHSFTPLTLVGQEEGPCKEFGVDLATGREVAVDSRLPVICCLCKEPMTAPGTVCATCFSNLTPRALATGITGDGTSTRYDFVASSEALPPAPAPVIDTTQVPTGVMFADPSPDTNSPEEDAAMDAVETRLPWYHSPTVILWYHPESDCYFTNMDPTPADPLCMDVTGIQEHEDEFKRRESHAEYSEPLAAEPVAEEVQEIPAPAEEAPEALSEKAPTTSDKDPDGIPTVDDTRQWERTIGDLPQAFEALRPTIRLLIQGGLADALFTRIYSAAFQAKEVARTRDFINLFNKELPTRLNAQGDTLNAWFEPWLNDVTKRTLSFDGSEESQAGVRFILKLVPDDRKKEISDYLVEHYVNTGVSRFFPEAVRRYKEASQRSTIGFPVTWILKTAESMDEQAQKEMKRPPTVDPALIEHALDLMPLTVDRPWMREHLMHHLAIGNGIFMDAILSSWETGFGGSAMPAMRYSAIHHWLKDRGKLYLNTKEAITLTAQEILWNLLGFIQPRVEEPIGAQTWQESNAAQTKWITTAWDAIEEHTIEGELVYEGVRQKFYDEMWTKGRKEALQEKI